MFDLTNKVAFVTGASSGIGRGAALALAKQGAKVAIAARRIEKLEEVACEIRALGREVLVLQIDITKIHDIKAATKKAEETFGRFDILVNNAGMNAFASSFRMTEEQWDTVIDTNLKGCFFTAQYAARKMAKNAWGRIINIASVLSGGVGSALPGEANYCSSKGGLVGMTAALALEFAPFGILVNAIGPGFVSTEMTQECQAESEYNTMFLQRIPMKRFGTVDEIAAGVVFLASDEASYITGVTLYIDGGWTAA
jgi:NAD(P)-dependent dehydrogenase (short-subunit alcohol dehydrogenase family)